FQRYAADSVKFSDAKTSSFGELSVGDQVRALGNRSADGTRLEPEQIVSGAFRNVSGAVKEVHADRHEVVMTDQESGKPVTVTVGEDAMIRRIPAEMAARFRGRAGGFGAAGAGGPGGPGGRAAAGGGEGARPADGARPGEG